MNIKKLDNDIMHLEQDLAVLSEAVRDVKKMIRSGLYKEGSLSFRLKETLYDKWNCIHELIKLYRIDIGGMT